MKSQIHLETALNKFLAISGKDRHEIYDVNTCDGRAFVTCCDGSVYWCEMFGKYAWQFRLADR